MAFRNDSTKKIWQAPTSIFYEQPISKIPKSKYQRIILPNAKNNFQNRGKQKSADAKAKKRDRNPSN